jgi:hypothetical protein
MNGCVRQVKTRWGVTWQVLFFLPRVAGFPGPRSQMTWTLGFLYFFHDKSKIHHFGGKVLKKNIEKTVLQEYDFSQNLFV